MTHHFGAPVGGTARSRYRDFMNRCRDPQGRYRLTPNAEPTPYALCFAIFGLHLLREAEELQRHRLEWDSLLRLSLQQVRARRQRFGPLGRDKPYLQLLTFTLSALAVLGTLDRESLAGQVAPLIPRNIEAELRACGVLQGRPRSGNHAMFMGILLLHARDRLGIDTQAAIDRWIELHRQHVNRYGFWGDAESMSHLQFQNGYHQYELLEYLHARDFPWDVAAHSVAALADSEGHFAPYPGGGGCYDYDAVFMLTAANPADHGALLATTARTVSAEQNPDGGFCESRFVRPRSAATLRRTVRHIARGRGRARWERLRYGLTLLRPQNDRIHTHWSEYSRGWNESNLWDSWFRMLTLARIEVAFEPQRARDWGFIDYPGIGFHPSVRVVAAN